MPLGKIEAIKKFFEADGGRKISMPEMQAMSAAERTEVAELCAVELGEELKVV